MGAGTEMAITLSSTARRAIAAAEIPGVCSSRSKAIPVRRISAISLRSRSATSGPNRDERRLGVGVVKGCKGRFAVGRPVQREADADRGNRPQAVRRFDLVDEPHPLAAQYRQVYGLAVGRARDPLDRRPEDRGDVRCRSSPPNPSRRSPSEKRPVRIDAGQPHLDQADQQSPSRRLGQPEALAEVDQTQPSGLGGDLVERGCGATQHLDSFVSICRRISFRPGHHSTIVVRIADYKGPKCGSKEFQMSALPAGRHFFRGDDGYEAARRGTVWHQRVPERYPEVIVQAADTDDIVAGLRYAKANGHKVSIVSGGHSFAASHLRDGAVLLDVSRLDHATIDAEKGLAVVGPGKGGSLLMADLRGAGPVLSRAATAKASASAVICCRADTAGTAGSTARPCESVVGLDVITADGEQIHCDEDNHADLYWAARGAGPGFFGVVTSFYLKLYPRPAACGTSVYVYPFDLADEVFTWARAVSAEVDPRRRAAGRRLARRTEHGHRHPCHLVRVARVRRLRGGGRKGPRPVRHLSRSPTRRSSKFLICQPICPPGMTSR